MSDAATLLRYLLCVFLLALSSACVQAANGAWERGASPIFRHVELPKEITPTAMMQDGEGGIWVASQTGLSSWDGYRFHNYIADPDRPGSLPLSWINALLEDRDGRVWVATDSGGLARLDKATGRFWTLGAGSEGLSSARVFALATDAAGGLWVGTGLGLDRLDLATGKVLRHADGGMPPGLPSRRIGALLVDRRGNLWVGTFEGIYVLRTGGHAFQPVGTAGPTRTAIEVRRLMEDGAGRVWVGTRATGAFVIEPGAAVARQVVDSEHSDRKALETAWVASMVDVGNDRVWLGTWAQGIVQVDTRSWKTRRLRHDPGLPASLGKDDVPVLLRDHSGLIWAAGPNLFDSHNPEQHAVSTWYGGSDRLLGDTSAEVTVVLVQPDGNIWLGSDHGGVDIIPPDRGHGLRLTPQDAQPRTSLPKSAVLSMAGSPDGSVYIGTAKGMYRARDGGRSVTRMEFPAVAPTALVRALCVADGRLWIGGTDGLRRVELAKRGEAASGVPGLQGSDITTLTCLKDGSLWIGTPTGLVRYWPTTGRIERPWPEAPEHAGLPSSRVTSVVEDGRGRLWVAFFGGGVRVVEPGKGGAAAHVHRIDYKQGIGNNAANALLLDARGNAWVSTDNGILRIDSDTLATTLLQQSDGVGLLAYWTSAAGITPEGDLLFGGNGLTIVHPDEFQPCRFKAPIVLTEVDGRPASSPAITLGPSQHAVQVTFSLLDYSAPERTRYAYRLAGLEEAWTDSSAELRVARYTNVPPGNYTLEIKASNRTGDWTLARWPLHAEPAWYETSTFRATLAVLGLVLLWTLLRLRTQLLVRRAAGLRELVEQRTQELEQRTGELQASRHALRELGAHNARSLEDERKRVARELHDELGQQLAALGMEVSVLRMRSGSGQAPAQEHWEEIRARVDRLVASMRSLVTGLRPPALDGGLAAAIEWLAGEFSRSTGVPCEVQLGDDSAFRGLRSDVATMVFRIAQESLNNVRRHAQARHVSLSLRRDAGDWSLTVLDDGTGFDIAGPRTGYGLLGMEERARLLGGTLQVESVPGRGTRVQLRIRAALPDGDQHDPHLGRAGESSGLAPGSLPPGPVAPASTGR